MNTFTISYFNLDNYRFVKRYDLEKKLYLDKFIPSNDELNFLKDNLIEWNNFLNSQTDAIRTIFVLFNGKYCYYQFFISMKNGNISWIGFTNNYSVLRENKEEYILFENFINDINKLEPLEKLSHWIFTTGTHKISNNNQK